jgi:hypothetical protein
MRFSARSKVGILISLVTILTLLSAFAVTTFAGRGTATQAAHSTHSVTYHGHTGKAVARKLHVTKAVTHALKKHAAGKQHTALPGHFGKASSARLNAARRNAPAVGVAGSSAVDSPRVNEGGLLQNFHGLTSTSSALVQLNGQAVLPPDQALCAGHDSTVPPSAGDGSNPNVVFEMINLQIVEYDTAGNVVTSDLLPFGTDNVNDFFGETQPPFFGELVSDPNCVFDKASDTFYFEMLGTDLFSTFTESHDSLVVYNASSGLAALYKFDTSDVGNTNCPCLADQGKLGVDNHAVYISSDEFQFLGLGGQNGAELLAINKTDLLAGVSNINCTNPIVCPGAAEFSFFNNIVDPNNSSIPITSLQPAVSISPSNTEYLVNSIPFDQFGFPNPTSKTLGFWTVTHDEDIPNSNVTLTGTDIASERYAFSVPAASSGDGSVFANVIQNNDNRMMQAEFIGGNVWAALESAVNIAGDSTTRDGIAWFKIGVHSQTVRQQGFIGSSHNNLLFPSIQVTTEGTVGIAFSITGPSLNPTAAFIVRKAGQSHFSSIHRAWTGLSPSFNGDGNVRWGDYSRATLDPNGKDIWMATEFSEVPTPDDVFIGLNDATQVFEVKGDH